jgi:hypothetical protein
MANDTDIAVVIAYLIYFYMQECLFNTQGRSRLPALFDDCLDWGRIIARHGTRASFKRHLHMSLSSFNKLLSSICPELEVDILQSSQRGGAILPEIKLYCTLHWLASGSYSDIYMFAGISKPSFYQVCWQTIKVLFSCPDL